MSPYLAPGARSESSHRGEDFWGLTAEKNAKGFQDDSSTLQEFICFADLVADCGFEIGSQQRHFRVLEQSVSLLFIRSMIGLVLTMMFELLTTLDVESMAVTLLPNLPG